MTSPMPLHRQQASPQLRLVGAQDQGQDTLPLPQEAAQTGNKRARQIQPTPIPLVARRSEQITIRSDALNHVIVDSLRSKEDYVKYEEQMVAERRGTLFKGEGRFTIAIQPEEGEGWETVLEALNTLGDGCVDTYLAFMAIAIDFYGVDHIRTPFQISPDDILEVCGKKKSNGSYTPFQRAEVIKHLKTLSQTYVIATIPGKQGNRRGKKQDSSTVIRAEGPLIELLRFKIGEYHTITGEEVWEKRSVIIGPWVTMIPDLSRNTATMLRQVLAYSAKNERYQKRLGTYLTFMFRINAKHGGQFPNDITMEALLRGAGITPPREQGKFKEAIEHALNCLQRDHVIGSYWRVVDAGPTGLEIEKDIRERGRGWFAAYLQQKWNFSPPPAILAQYRSLLRPASEANSDKAKEEVTCLDKSRMKPTNSRMKPTNSRMKPTTYEK